MSVSAESLSELPSLMSTSLTEDLLTGGRGSAYSPAASTYSTYSHEVKYIFEPHVHSQAEDEEEESTAAEEEDDEYGDYSHIAPRAAVNKPGGKGNNYFTHTPRALSAASSHASGKENHTPHSHQHQLQNQHSLEDAVFVDLSSSASYPSGPGSSFSSNSSRDRGPISPRLEEALYASSHGVYGPGPRKQKPQQPVGVPNANHPQRDRRYSQPAQNLPPHHPYAKQGYPVWKQNSTGSMGPQGHSPYKNTNIQQEVYRRSGVALSQNNYHPQQHQNIHLPHPQYPNNPHQQKASQGHYHPPLQQNHPQQQLRSPQMGHPQVIDHPPYPQPPRYSYQQHSRRKTWSPPALKVSLLGSGCQAAHTRVCHSNDSLDLTAVPEGGMIGEGDQQRKALSLSEDLDTTPPRLAPISGVLAQKPGPNLIKPIAYKPVNGTSPRHSPNSQGPRRAESGTPPEMTRPMPAVKLGTSMLGVRASPEAQAAKAAQRNGAFNSTKSQQQANPSQGYAGTEGGHQYQPHPTGLPPQSGSAHASGTSNYRNLSVSSQHNLSANSLSHSHLSVGDESSFCNEFQRPSDRPDSVPSLNTSRLSSQHAGEGSSMFQTPSPSDSGVGELEAMLREKDAEINTLREVMDRNERAILQVYEERKNAWLHDSQELRDDYERKMKVQSRKSYKTEQVLSLQVYKLQQEQKSLQEEKVNLTSERDKLKEELEKSQVEIARLKNLLGQNNSTGESVSSETAKAETNSGANDSVQEELALKNKELITLKSKLQSYELDMEKKTKEVSDKVREVSNKSDYISQLKQEINRLKDPPILVEAASQTHVPCEIATTENVKPSMLGEKDKAINSLQNELLEIKTQLAALKEEHEREREQWLDEKNKVVRYQKQLQLNYVQMQRKNVTLETEVQQLTLELENRDMKLIALNGEESVC